MQTSAPFAVVAGDTDVPVVVIRMSPPGGTLAGLLVSVGGALALSCGTRKVWFGAADADGAARLERSGRALVAFVPTRADLDLYRSLTPRQWELEILPRVPVPVRRLPR